MFFLKNNFILFLLLSFLFTNDWVLKYKEAVFYEDDFYLYFPKADWEKINNNNKRLSVLDGFTKQAASVYEAKLLGLDKELSVAKKLGGRFNRLLINEYYMKYFLGSILPKGALSFCKQNLKKEVFVNHVLLKKEDNVFALSLLDSLSGGVDFGSLAFSFSQDPSAKQNKGVLGWVAVGQTVPKFQDFIFRLCVGCVGFVETDFGVHVVRVDSVKKSFYSSLDKQEYNDFAFQFATGYIEKPRLAFLAAEHDSSLLSQFNVVFDHKALDSFVGLVLEKTLSSRTKSRDGVDFLGLLGEVGVVARFGNSFLSGRWFVNKLSGPFYKNVFFDSIDPLLKELRLVLLREIVLGLSLKNGLDKGFSFQKQFLSVKNEILKKEFLKYLVNSVERPSKQEVELYYYKHENGLFANKKTGKPFGLASSYESVEVVLLKEKQDLVKDVFFNSLKKGGVELNEVWLYVD